MKSLKITSWSSLRGIKIGDTFKVVVVGKSKALKGGWHTAPFIRIKKVI